MKNVGVVQGHPYLCWAVARASPFSSSPCQQQQANCGVSMHNSNGSTSLKIASGAAVLPAPPAAALPEPAPAHEAQQPQPWQLPAPAPAALPKPAPAHEAQQLLPLRQVRHPGSHQLLPLLPLFQPLLFCCLLSHLLMLLLQLPHRS